MYIMHKTDKNALHAVDGLNAGVRGLSKLEEHKALGAAMSRSLHRRSLRTRPGLRAEHDSAIVIASHRNCRRRTS
jgi:hypothetical protein